MSWLDEFADPPKPAAPRRSSTPASFPRESPDQRAEAAAKSAVVLRGEQEDNPDDPYLPAVIAREDARAGGKTATDLKLVDVSEDGSSTKVVTKAPPSPPPNDWLSAFEGGSSAPPAPVDTPSAATSGAEVGPARSIRPLRRPVTTGSQGDVRKVDEAIVTAGTRQTTLQDSVMEDSTKHTYRPADEQASPVAPVSRKAYDRYAQQFDLMEPEVRKRIAAQQSPAGAVFRHLLGEALARVGALSTTREQVTGTRLSDRTGRAARAGASDATAQGIATAEIMAGIGPQATASASDGGVDAEGARLFGEGKALGAKGSLAAVGFEQGKHHLGQALSGALQLYADATGDKAVGEEISKDARQQKAFGDGINEAMQRRPWGDRIAAGTIASLTMQGPLIPLMYVLPAVGIAGIGIQTFFSEYQGTKLEGKTASEALQRATILGLSESLTELTGLASFKEIARKTIAAIRTGEVAPQSAGKLFANHIKNELTGEEINTTVNFVVDKFAPFGLTPGASGADYIQQLIDTAAQTVLQTGAMVSPIAVTQMKADTAGSPSGMTPEVGAAVARENAMSKMSGGLEISDPKSAQQNSSSTGSTLVAGVGGAQGEGSSAGAGGPSQSPAQTIPFVPTHDLDGLPVRPLLQGGKPVAGWWEDAQGEPVEALRAEPITKPVPNAELMVNGVGYPVEITGPGTGEKTARLADGQEVPLTQFAVIDDEIKPALGIPTPDQEEKTTAKVKKAPVAAPPAKKAAETPKKEAETPPKTPKLASVPVSETPPVTPTPVKPSGPPPKMEGTRNLQRQNRMRGNAASVAQMIAIAENPDYERLSESKAPESGAPMASISGDTDVIAPEYIGRTSLVTIGGQRVPVRYAVVEANSLLASNTAEGKERPEYFADPEPGQIRALNNGRAAGIREAYMRGNGAAYKTALLDDPGHGIASQVISKMERPVLIRLYPDSFNSSIENIGEKSQGETLRQSPLEIALQDAAKLDSEDMALFQPDEKGDIDAASNLPFVNMFLGRLSNEERGALVTQGTNAPNGSAYARIRSAVFQKAYGSEFLTGLQSESADSEAGALIRALSIASSEMAQLDGSPPELDVRPYVAEAAKLVVQARRAGQTLEAYLKEGVLLPRDVAVVAIAEMFAVNMRSPRLMGDALISMARFGNWATEQGKTGDVFGDPVQYDVSHILKAGNKFLEEAYAERQAAKDRKDQPPQAAQGTAKYDSGREPPQVDHGPGAQGGNAAGAARDGQGQREGAVRQGSRSQVRQDEAADDTGQSVMDQVLEGIEDGKGNAILLRNNHVPAFERMLVSAGWEQRKVGKSVDWVKDGWKLFLRGQGEGSGTIVQWSKDERDAPTPKLEAPADLLATYTEQEIKDREAAAKKAAEDKAKADAAPKAKPVTADQADIFNTQGSLFEPGAKYLSYVLGARIALGGPSSIDALSGNVYVVPGNVLVERGGRDVHTLADALDIEALRREGLKALDAPSQRMVLAAVLARADDPKILGSVIGLDAVQMVNMLGGPKVTADDLRHDSAVLRDRLSVDVDVDVSILSDPTVIERFGRASSDIADLIAETPLVTREVSGSVDGRGAVSTSNKNAPRESVATDGAEGPLVSGERGRPKKAERAMLASELDRAAHEAATSPLNDLPEPTEEQKKAGNYKKGDFWLSGIRVRIENPQGSRRRPKWPSLKDHYGYIIETSQGQAAHGYDKDHVDVFVKPGTAADWAGTVYVINQLHPESNTFDEHKLVIGAASEVEAEEIYHRNYEEGWDGFDSIVPLSIPAFKSWAYDHSRKGPKGGLLTGKEARRREKLVAQQAVPDAGRSDPRNAGAAPQLDLFAPTALPGGAQAIHTTKVVIEKQRSVILPAGNILAPIDAARAFKQLGTWPREKFQMIGVDEKGVPVAFYDLFAGTLTQTSVHPREVWLNLYQTPGVRGVWLGHNHPSGVPAPSQADQNITATLKDLLQPGMGVTYKGHVIIAGNQYYSLEEYETGLIGEPTGEAKSVPVMERRMEFSESGDALTTPEATHAYISKMGTKNSGVIFLDAQHRVQGWWPMTLEEIGELPTKKNVAATLRLVGEYNPAAMIVYADPSYEFSRSKILTMGLQAFFRGLDIKVLDVFAHDAQEGVRPDGTAVMVSHAEKGLMQARGSYAIAPRQPGMKGDAVHGILKGHPLYEAMGERVVVVQNPLDVPDHVLAQWQEDGVPPNQIRGYYDPVEGRTYLIAANLSPRTVLRTLLHEAVGHFGVDQVLNREDWTAYENTMLEIYESRQGAIMAEANGGFLRSYNFDFRVRMHRIAAAQEWIAHKAERGEEQGLWQKVVAMLRAALRKAGFVKEWSENDLLHILKLSESALRNGSAATYNGVPAMSHGGYSRRSPANREGPRPLRVKQWLQKALKQREDGLLTDEQFADLVKEMVAEIEQTRFAQDMTKIAKPRSRGQEWFAERMIRARRTGELSPEMIDFAGWFVQRAPHVVDELGLSIRAKLPGGVSGNYNTVARIASFARGSHNWETGVHEILHHTERMMPIEVQRGITLEFEKQMMAAWAKATPIQREVLVDMVLLNAGDERARDRVIQAFYTGKVPFDFYQYTNASEFWAVNATRILAGRYNATSWIAKAKQWLRELIEKIKALFGKEADAAVIRGLESVLAGDGAFLNNNMLHSLVDTRLQNLDNIERGSYARTDRPNTAVVYGVSNGRVQGMARRAFNGGVWEVFLGNRTNESLFARGQFRRMQAASFTEVRRLFATAGLEVYFNTPTNTPIPDRSLFDNDWMAPTAETLFRRTVIYFQNRLLLPEQYERTIGKEVGAVPQEAMAHREARLAHPRAAGKIADFDHEYTDRLVQLMKTAELSMREVGEFLYALHAPERNAAIEEINPENKAGSGMTNERAATILLAMQAMPPAKWQALQEIGVIAREVNRFREEALVDKGLVKREAVLLLRQKYPNYVPLKEITEDEHIQSEAGGGYKVGRLINTAFGRFTEAQAEYVLPALIAQAKGTIAAGENAEVLRAFLKLVSFAPNPQVWEVIRSVSRPHIDKDSGQVRWHSVPIQQDRASEPYVISVPVDGDRYHVRVKDARLAQAFKTSGLPLGESLQIIGSITRFYALAATAMNPEFVLTNLIRDFQQAMIRITGEQNPKLAAKIAKDVIPAMWGALSGLRAKGQYTAGSSYPGADTWHQWYRRFIEAGGHIAYRGIQDPLSEHQDFIVALADAGIFPSEMAVWERFRLLAHRAARVSGAKWASKWVIDVNGMVENALRLSAFKNAIEAGWNEKDAAMLARTVTVDFNLKGEAGTRMGALYMFANANLQGGALLFRSVVNNRGVQIAALLLFALGAGMDWWDAEHSKDTKEGRKAYDDISEDIKEKNIVIMAPNGVDAITAPLPFGFNVFYNAGRNAMAVMRGVKTPLHAAVDMFVTTINAFSPLGVTPKSMMGALQIISPTFTDSFVQAATNRTFNDRPIKPERPRWADPQSKSYTYFQGTPQHYIDLAQWMNEQTGGNQVRSGYVDISPNMLRHWANSIFSSSGAFYARAFGMLGNELAGRETAVRDTPFLRRFYYEPKDFELSQRFYDNINSAEVAELEVRKAYERNDSTGARVLSQEFQAERGMFGEARHAEKQVSQLRSEIAKLRRHPTMGDDQKKMVVERLDEQSREVMSMFNKKFNTAVERSQ